MGECSWAPGRAQPSLLPFKGKTATFVEKEREFQPPQPKGEAEGVPCLLASGICD